MNPTVLTSEFRQFPAMETERLLLRKCNESDIPVLFFLRSDPSVNQFIKRAKPKNIQEIKEFIQRINDGMLEGKNINWCITLKEDPTMIGNICLWNFSEDRKTAEVGYDLHPDYHGKGLMTEAIKKIIQFGFQQLKLYNIDAYTQKNNLPSIQLLRKNGFHPSPTKSDIDNPLNMVLTRINIID